MALEQILFDIDDEIATVTLNRPEALNALSAQMMQELDKVLDEIAAKAGNEVKAMILTGAGRAFCAGGDVKSMSTRVYDTASRRESLRGTHERVYKLLNLELPVISLVQGPAAGAGANIALAADFVLATPKAMFMQAFGRIGLVPDYGGFFTLPRLIGLQRAKELIFTARKVGAEEAKSMGMVYEIVDADDPMQAAREFAGRFRHASTIAIGAAKNVLNQSLNLDFRAVGELEAYAQALCSGTDYHKQAARRFAAKEAAMFDWEKLSGD
ncbi:MAG: enoyl-CoA hydratase/isomerase family protein [Gammaproteobacteria bacterium]|nr:enoyl-CoA hydratase/isomerase family protein [Gammaproteobacteria bacterium]